MTRLDEQAELAGTAIELVAESQAAKPTPSTWSGAAWPMQHAAPVAQLEHALTQTVAVASGRLSAIADVTAVSLTTVATDTAAHVRRL